MAVPTRSRPARPIPRPSPGLLLAGAALAAMVAVLAWPFAHAPTVVAAEQQAITRLQELAAVATGSPDSAPAEARLRSLLDRLAASLPDLPTEPVPVPAGPATRRTAVDPPDSLPASNPGSQSAPAPIFVPAAFRWREAGYWFQAALVPPRDPVLEPGLELLAWPEDRGATGSAVFAWHAAGSQNRGLFQSRNVIQGYEGSVRAPQPGASLPIGPRDAGSGIHLGRDRERWRLLPAR